MRIFVGLVFHQFGIAKLAIELRIRSMYIIPKNYSLICKLWEYYDVCRSYSSFFSKCYRACRSYSSFSICRSYSTTLDIHIIEKKTILRLFFFETLYLKLFAQLEGACHYHSVVLQVYFSDLFCSTRP